MSGVPQQRHTTRARRRPVWRPIILAVAVLTIAAGCGDSSDDGSAGSDESSAQGPGPFFGECGSVTDDEVAGALGVPAFGTVTRDSAGCQWEVAAPGVAPADRGVTPAVSFSWYRGSPIARERAGSDLFGRPSEDLEIDGHPGFRGYATGESGVTELCEIGIEFGDDFQHWSVTYGWAQPTADPCAVATELAQLSIGRAQQ